MPTVLHARSGDEYAYRLVSIGYDENSTLVILPDGQEESAFEVIEDELREDYRNMHFLTESQARSLANALTGTDVLAHANTHAGHISYLVSTAWLLLNETSNAEEPDVIVNAAQMVLDNASEELDTVQAITAVAKPEDK